MKPIIHLIYLNANNFNGWAMSQPLPTGGFRWIPEESIIKDPAEILSLIHGFIYEMDLDYPSNLHDKHISYPLALERLTIEDASTTTAKFPKTSVTNNIHVCTKPTNQNQLCGRLSKMVILACMCSCI